MFDFNKKEKKKKTSYTTLYQLAQSIFNLEFKDILKFFAEKQFQQLFVTKKKKKNEKQVNLLFEKKNNQKKIPKK